MENLSYDQPHESTQTTRSMLVHVGIVIVAVLLLAVAAGVGTFIGKVDGLTMALVDMRQSCLMEKQP